MADIFRTAVVIAGAAAMQLAGGAQAWAQQTPDATTYAATQKVCSDLTGTTDCTGTPVSSPTLAQIKTFVTDLNQTELDRLAYRVAWPDAADPTAAQPHTPVSNDFVLSQTSAALNELAASSPSIPAITGYAKAAYAAAYTNSVTNPPPYGSRAYRPGTPHHAAKPAAKKK